MGNALQRRQNRAVAQDLANSITAKKICPRCHQPGRHYVVDPMPSFGGDCSGWLCDAPTDENKEPK